jgi:hypothetical protein
MLVCVCVCSHVVSTDLEITWVHSIRELIKTRFGKFTKIKAGGVEFFFVVKWLPASSHAVVHPHCTRAFVCAMWRGKKKRDEEALHQISGSDSDKW